MISALLFDLDGLLTDTERLHFEAYRRVLAELGISLDEEFYAEHWIRKGLKIEDVCKIKGWGYEPQFLRSRKIKLYFELVRSSLQPMPGAREILQRFHSKKKMALVTSAYSDAANCVVESFGVRDLFDHIVTASDVERMKPDPEPFLKAAELLGVAPQKCVVIEDAEKGIVAAARAGMRSIAIPSDFTRTNDFSLATLRLQSLDEITEALIASL